MTATGVLAPEGIAGAVAIVADFVAFVAAVVWALYAYGSTTARIPEALASCSPGEWPSPHSSTYSDGSLRDGDTTDWRLRM